VIVRARPLPRLVAVLKHANALVFEDHLVLVGIRCRRVSHHDSFVDDAGHGGRTSPQSRPEPTEASPSDDRGYADPIGSITLFRRDPPRHRGITADAA
jgi:hypothetical protein